MSYSQKYKRSNSEHNQRDRQSQDNEQREQDIGEGTYDENLSTGSPDRKEVRLQELLNCSNQIKSRFMSCYNEDYDCSQESEAGIRIAGRVKGLMQSLRELIKELCLTKTSVIQVQQQLGKTLAQFSDTMTQGLPGPNKTKNRSNSLFEDLSEIHARSSYQIGSTTQARMPGHKFFSKFLQGTVHEDSPSLPQCRLDSYQQQLIEEFMQRYLSLLQKQINRISRYKGQKKLKYLLQTVMKQIFVQLMRFTYQTKVQVFKDERSNLLNHPHMKASIFTATLSRIVARNSFIRDAFHSIKQRNHQQTKSDARFVKSLQIKVNLLDNLLKIKQRQQSRLAFLKWRGSSILAKQVQRQSIFSGINGLVRQILFQFAQNEVQTEKWKYIIWSRMNSFIRSLCSFGQSILFPAGDQVSVEPHFQMSLQTSYDQSRVRSEGLSDSYRYSIGSQQQKEESFEVGKRMLEEIREIFTREEITTCLKKGQIVVNQTQGVNMMLIPVKSVSGIIGVRFHQKDQFKSLNYGQQKSQNKININNFYNILTALQACSPMILDLMHLKQKFQYFSQRIHSNSYHKFILADVLQLSCNKLRTNSISQDDNQTKDAPKRMYSILSQIPSITQRSAKNDTLLSFEQRLQYVDQSLTQMNVRSLIMYHRQKSNCISTCLSYTVGQDLFQFTKFISRDIVQAIFTELQKINKKSSIYGSRCLYLKKSNLIFYAYPIYESDQLIGFIQIHLNQDISQINASNKKFINNQNSYLVEPIDIKNQILNQMVTFVSQGIIPILIQIKCKNKNNSKNKNNNKNNTKLQQKYSSCQHCRYQQTKREEQYRKQIAEIQCQKQTQSQNPIKIKQLNNLFLKYRNFQRQQKVLYQLQKQIYQLIQEQVHSFQNNQIVEGQSFAKCRQQSIKLIQQQFFMRIFYLRTPVTKDNKFYTSHLKKEQNDPKAQFYHTDLTNADGKAFSTYNMKFIDKLQLFQNKKGKYYKPAQLSVAKLIETYKQMMRRQKGKAEQNISDLNEYSQNNIFQMFIQQILRSALLKKDASQLKDDRKYHSLQLWLYQLQHINKQYPELEIKFQLTTHPVFSRLDGKNRYLSSIVCSGGFVVEQKQGKFKQNRKFSFRNTKYLRMNKLVQAISKKLVGRIVELNLNQRSKVNQTINTNYCKILAKREEDIQFKQHQYRKKLNKIETSSITNYNRGQQYIKRFINATIYIQSSLEQIIKSRIKNKITPKFYLNFRCSKLHILDRMNKLITSKLIVRNMNTRSNILSQFIRRLLNHNLNKSQSYFGNIIIFEREMVRVVIRNKMLKLGFCKIKSIMVQLQGQDQVDLLGQGHEFGRRVKLPQKFAIQRLTAVLSKKLFNTKQSQSIVYDSFCLVKGFSNHLSQLCNYQRHHSLYLFQTCLKKLITRKSYLPYFQQLQCLQKSLYQNISLIGTQIESMNFHSLSEFLKFINERISIIVKGERRLISILYGKLIENVNVFFIVQNKESKEKFKLALSQADERLLFQRDNSEKLSNLTKTVETDSNIIYLSFTFVQAQTQVMAVKGKQTLKDLTFILRKVFQNNISAAFQKFFFLFENKIKAFCLRVSRNLKIKSYLSKKNKRNGTKQQQFQLMTKKYAFKKLQNQFVKSYKHQKANQLSKQIQRKTRQLEQLQVVYDKKTKKLNSLQNTGYNKQKQGSLCQEQFQNIITKGMIKGLKQSIQSSDLNSENLSIQYQIKSKTVAGYQIMTFINQFQRKQTMLNVASAILELNQTPLASSSRPNTNRNLYQDFDKQNKPFSANTLTEQKQKLNYLRTFRQQEQNFYNQKFRNTSIRSIFKVLKNTNKNVYKRAFYLINSFSCLNSPIQTHR